MIIESEEIEERFIGDIKEEFINEYRADNKDITIEEHNIIWNNSNRIRKFRVIYYDTKGIAFFREI